MNNLNKTIYQVIEHSTNIKFQGENKKAFQLIKYVTGKNKSDPTDYEVIEDKHYGYDAVTLRGKLGFIRITLKPLFEVI